MSEATTGSAHANARVRTIPKLSPPSDGAASAFAVSSSLVSCSWLRKPSTSIPSDGTRSRRWSSPTASGSAPINRSRAPVAAVNVRPCTQQHLQPLAGLVPADERDVVLSVRRVSVRRNQDAVRDDVVCAGQPARGGVARLLGDRDPMVQPVHQEAPEMHGPAHPAEVARGMEGRDHRTARQRGHHDADRGRHRLVQVENVKTLALEHPLDPEHGSRAQGEVRERAVRRHDHRAADRDHVRRRVTVPAETGMQRARKAAGWVVGHDRADVEPELPKRLRLELSMLHHRAPERPGVRNDDSDLHVASIERPSEPDGAILEKGRRRPKRQSPEAPPRRPRLSHRSTWPFAWSLPA